MYHIVSDIEDIELQRSRMFLQLYLINLNESESSVKEDLIWSWTVSRIKEEGEEEERDSLKGKGLSKLNSRTSRIQSILDVIEPCFI